MSANGRSGPASAVRADVSAHVRRRREEGRRRASRPNAGRTDRARRRDRRRQRAQLRPLPATVTEVIAVEPEPYLRGRAEEAAARAAVKITVVDGTASSIPLDDASVDAGVASLVLCSVPDQAAALAELHRVIRPGGELRFYEHVIADNDRWARRQRRADPIWTRLAGGCHLNRDTATAIRDAGFEIADRANGCSSLPASPPSSPPRIFSAARPSV